MQEIDNKTGGKCRLAAQCKQNTFLQFRSIHIRVPLHSPSPGDPSDWVQFEWTRGMSGDTTLKSVAQISTLKPRFQRIDGEFHIYMELTRLNERMKRTTFKSHPS
jgi:hypothetical protein